MSEDPPQPESRNSENSMVALIRIRIGIPGDELKANDSSALRKKASAPLETESF
jgi:hypothetical protein